MAGVPGTASTIFGAVKDVGANVIMISQVPDQQIQFHFEIELISTILTNKKSVGK